MRTFKFRVWDEFHKRFLVSLNDNGLLFGFGNLSNDDIEKYGGWGVTECLTTPNSGLIVQQFTGLLDKNGKEIYEGDIIVGKFDLGLVGWVDHKWIVQWHNELGYQWNYWKLDTIEVVGNIFD